MDTSTFLVVFLLVTAASLASYALSHWSSIRSAAGFGWAATSIGTTMLLVAAAVVVLTFVFRGPLWRPNLGAEQPVHERAAASEETSARRVGGSVASLKAENISTATANPTAEAARQRRGIDDSPDARGNEAQASNQAPTAAPDPTRVRLGSQYISAFQENDPWAATRCVHVFHPGSDPSEWKIENDCDVPVGLSVADCPAGTQECGRGRPMLFPAKLQRSIPLDEQIVHGYNLQFVACFAATPSMIYLMGAPSEERSTESWRIAFEDAGVNDGCVLRIQNLWPSHMFTDRSASQGGRSVP